MFLLVRSILFLLPAECAHGVGLWFVRCLGFIHRVFQTQKVMGHVPSPFGNLLSPVGLAAGMDKDGVALWGWQALGFGFVEIGTVTPVPQKGNPKPRLFRLTKEAAIINRMGFNNHGIEALVARVAAAKRQGLRIPVGINIGKNKDTPLEQAASDYGSCARALSVAADYLVVNVSSPNTPGLRELQTKESLVKIIEAVKVHSGNLPLFIKIAPDHYTGFQQGIVDVAMQFQLAGIICGNTLAGHGRAEQGGLSGKPILVKNLELASSYHKKAPALFLIGVGGIMDREGATAYMNAGCKLVQIYTGLVYRGPNLVRELNVAFNSSSKN